MEVISLDQAFKPIEVKLDNHEYQTVPLTRSVQIKLNELSKQIDEADTDDADRIVDLIAKHMDTMLAGKGKQPKPSTIINKKWKGNQLTIDALMRATEKLTETIRPT